MDSVNRPPHYNQVPNIECIEVVRHFNFNRGNAIKYIWRAGDKSFGTEIEDLRKAIWYLNDEIKRLEGSDIALLPSSKVDQDAAVIEYTPPWEDYDKKYKWWAVDSTGRAYLFDEKPEACLSAWTVGSDGLFRRDEFYNNELKGINWEETLRERPVRQV